MGIVQEVEMHGINKGVRTVMFGADYLEDNREPIMEFMEKYTGNQPYVTFVLESVLSSYIQYFIAPGVDCTSMNAEMKKFYEENREWYKKLLAEQDEVRQEEITINKREESYA